MTPSSNSPAGDRSVGEQLREAREWSREYQRRWEQERAEGRLSRGEQLRVAALQAAATVSAGQDITPQQLLQRAQHLSHWLMTGTPSATPTLRDLATAAQTDRLPDPERGDGAAPPARKVIG